MSSDPLDLRWVTNPSPAEWLVERLTTFAVDVGSIVPECFPAVARISHRATTTMPAQEGSLDAASLTALLAVLGSRGASRPCWFAVWDGWGWNSPPISGHWFNYSPGPLARRFPIIRRCVTRTLRAVPAPLLSRLIPTHDPQPFEPRTPDPVPESVRSGPRVRLPGRDYYLYRGDLGDATAFMQFPFHQSPSLWWPDDRSWCVASEIDFAWTYVAGSADLVRAIVEDPGLEARPVDYRGRIS